MSIELRIHARRQTSPNSCWWEATAMILSYYGRSTSAISSLGPSGLRSGPRIGLPRSSVPDEDLALSELSTYGRVRSERAMPQMDSSEWYDHGLPMTPFALHEFAELTGLSSLSERPAFGSWEGADVERVLRQCGPHMFVGLWNGYLHAVVVTGYDATDERVSYADPAMGFVVSRTLEEFNDLMAGLAVAENPFWLRSPPQVRAVVYDRPGETD